MPKGRKMPHDVGHASRSGNSGSEVYYAVHNRPAEYMTKKASHHRFESGYTNGMKTETSEK